MVEQHHQRTRCAPGPVTAAVNCHSGPRQALSQLQQGMHSAAPSRPHADSRHPSAHAAGKAAPLFLLVFSAHPFCCFDSGWGPLGLRPPRHPLSCFSTPAPPPNHAPTPPFAALPAPPGGCLQFISHAQPRGAVRPNPTPASNPPNPASPPTLASHGRLNAASTLIFSL